MTSFFGGVHAVIGLEAFVFEFAFGDFHEEADDAPSAAGFFADDSGESLLWSQAVGFSGQCSIYSLQLSVWATAYAYICSCNE